MYDEHADDSSEASAYSSDTSEAEAEAEADTEAFELDSSENESTELDTHWNYFKPQKPGSLYYELLTKPNDALVVVLNYLEEFKQNKVKCALKLLQLAIDASGYQNFEIPKSFNIRTAKSFSDLVNKIQRAPPKYQLEYGLYFFQMTSEKAVISQNAIFAFIKTLTRAFYKSELFSRNQILDYFTRLLLYFNRSLNRAIRHTGVVIATKILTVSLKIKRKIALKSNKLSKEGIRKRREKYKILMNKEKALNTVISIYQTMIEQSCDVKDSELCDMKIALTKEMSIWFKIDRSLLSPERSKYFVKLMSFVDSENAKLRLAALKVCHKIAKSKDFKLYLKPLIKQFIEVIVKRVKDTDSEVQILAIKIFTSMLHLYRFFIRDCSRRIIFDQIYSLNCRVGIAAGEYLSNDFCTDARTKSRSAPIKKLVAFQKSRGKHQIIPILVESLLPSYHSLREWKHLMKLLLKDDSLDQTDKEILIEILSQATQQVVVGRCTKITREDAVRVEPNEADARLIWNLLLPKIPAFLKKFRDDYESLVHILDIILVMNFRDGHVHVKKRLMYSLVRKLHGVFITTDSPRLTNCLSEIFAIVTDDHCLWGERAQQLVEDIKQECMDEFRYYMRLERKEYSPDDTRKIELCLQRFSSLYYHHDVVECIKCYLSDLDSIGRGFSELATHYATSICFSYIKWGLTNLKNIRHRHLYIAQYLQLKTMATATVEMSFQHLRTLDSLWMRTQLLNEVHKLYLYKFQKRITEECVPLIFTITQHHEYASFVDFILFDPQTLECGFNTKRIILNYVMSMLKSKLVCSHVAKNIFKHYHSHYLYYGQIMNEYLDKIRMDSSELVPFIAECMFSCYTDERAQQFREADKLKNLVKQFRIYLSKHPKELKEIVIVAFTNAVDKPDYLGSLSYFKSFINFLPLEEKFITYKYLILKVPRRLKCDKMVLQYLVDLKLQHNSLVTTSAITSTITQIQTDEESDSEEVESEAPTNKRKRQSEEKSDSEEVESQEPTNKRKRQSEEESDSEEVESEEPTNKRKRLSEEESDSEEVESEEPTNKRKRLSEEKSNSEEAESEEPINKRKRLSEEESDSEEVESEEPTNKRKRLSEEKSDSEDVESGEPINKRKRQSEEEPDSEEVESKPEVRHVLKKGRLLMTISKVSHS